MHAVADALAVAGSMTWAITWALIPGFALSAVSQFPPDTAIPMPAPAVSINVAAAATAARRAKRRRGGDEGRVGGAEDDD
jgi:hypothetical protein